MSCNFTSAKKRVKRVMNTMRSEDHNIEYQISNLRVASSNLAGRTIRINI